LGDNRRLSEIAAEVLQFLDDKRSIKALITAIRQETGRMETTIHTPAVIGWEEAVETLLPLLKHRDEIVRFAAGRELYSLSHKRIDILSALLKGGEKPFRKRAAKGLGELGDIRVVGLLVDALNDREWEVREEVINALGALKSNQALNPILAMLQDENQVVRSAAQEVLRRVFQYKG
jgi:HEAT repeat protein